MKRIGWKPLLGLALALVLCFWLAICGLGFLLLRTAQARPIAEGFPTPTTPTPTADLVQRQPTAAERQTAASVANSELPQRDLLAIAHRLQGLPLPLPTAQLDNIPEYELGDSMVFWLHDVQTSNYYTTTATLRAKTSHAYWWIEDGYRVQASDLDDSAQNFEDQTYPTNHRFFGSEWNPGIDGDPRIYIFLGDVPGVGGYFSGPDEYPLQVRPRSNRHEMFYVNLDNAEPGSDYFDGILAHEHQHMIHWATDRNESTWVNEGLSELGGQVNGYDVGSTDVLFSQQPDTQLTTWADLQDSGPHYGASYLFLAYFFEKYGEKAIKQLVAEPANGIAGFDALLESIDPDPDGQRFDDLFADWIIANYLDAPDLAEGRYGYTDIQVEEPSHAAEHSTYPVHIPATVSQYAADYILLEGKGDLTIEFDGSAVVPLLGNKTHGGEYQWWSNRGDEGDATLTRAFDLSDLDQATLQVWMWYNLEKDYDYAYVQVSTDGGEMWDILANEHTTADNPSGNSYGPAFNGISGGGDEPEWELDTFDLSPYAGQQVLVRFEVITDEALNCPGLALDDLAIPELGYSYDVEEGDGGWQSEGWLRVTDHVPQDFIVQVIVFPETRIERLPLDENRRGAMTIPGLGDDVERAVLVISAIAPATTESTTYEYRITQK